MAENRDDFLARVATMHDEWIAEHEAGTVFDPRNRPDSGDYNVWNVDMDADPAAQQQLVEAIGVVDIEEDEVPADLMAVAVDDTGADDLIE